MSDLVVLDKVKLNGEMDNPGYTMFQGGDSIKINTSLTRIEEEEALEDQKRRNEELGNQLQFAFDDLMDDDDCTIDSSINLPNDMKSKSNLNDIREEILEDNKQNDHRSEMNDHHKTCEDEIKTLKKVIESKNREIENISKIVIEERKKNDELKKRLALSEAEKERAFMQKQQTHELLVESKTQISELEDSMMKLKTKIKNLEDSNNSLVGDLERTKMMLTDCQHKYHLVEKNAGLNANKHADILVNQLNEKHRAQIQMMQVQIDNLKRKLDDKESEYRTLDTKYKELQRSREELLIDKADTFNRLTCSLEEAQRQCHQLMAKQDFAQENIRLQKLVNSLERQTEDMQKTINSLTARLESTTSELELMDSVLNENGTESPRRLSQTKGNIVGSTPLTVPDRLTKLKNELYRSIASQKNKREEIKKLKEQLVAKTDEIKKLKDYENRALIEIETLKEEKTRFESKIHSLELEHRQLKVKSADTECSLQENFEEKLLEYKSKNEQLTNELENVQKEFKILKENSEKWKKEIDELHGKLRNFNEMEKEKDNLLTKLKILNSKLDEIKNENEKLKQDYDCLKNGTDISDVLKMQQEKYKFLLNDAQNECDRLKNIYADVSKEKAVLKAEVERLKSNYTHTEFMEIKKKYHQIEKALEMSELKCNELQKLSENQKIAYEKEINDLRNQLEKEKHNSKKNSDNLNNCTKCLENLTKMSKYEIENIKLQNQCSEYLNLQINLQERLKQAEEIINELTEKLTVKDESEKIIDELKLKARQFEEFIRSQSNSNGGSTSGISSSPKEYYQQNQYSHDVHKNLQKIQYSDKSVETTEDLNDQNNLRKNEIENEIRNEMAKAYACEMKRIEYDFQQNLRTLEKHNMHLKNDLHKINTELKQRQNEVQLLKHAILSEREKMQNILKNYEQDRADIIEKHTEILNKCRTEIKLKNDKIDELLNELNERNLQIESERKSMKAVMTRWEEEKQKNDKEIEKLKDLIEKHEKIVEQLQMKYDSVKKTAVNYKKYAEDKEKHMLKEYDRIKSGYEASLQKIEHKMKEILEKRENDMKERIREIESNYDMKLEKLRQQFDQQQSTNNKMRC